MAAHWWSNKSNKDWKANPQKRVYTNRTGSYPLVNVH